MIDDANDVSETFSGARAGGQNVIFALNGRPDHLLMLVEAQRFASRIFIFTDPENLCAFLSVEPLGDQLVNGRTGLKSWIKLDHRLRPEQTGP